MGFLNSFVGAINPFDGDVIPGVNVGNAVKQAGSYVGLAPKADYDIFGGVSLSGRPGQYNVPYAGTNPSSSYNGSGAAPSQSGFDMNYAGPGAGGGTYGSGTGGGQSSDPSQAAWYADQASQLQRQADGLGQQESIGLGNIGSSYNQSYNRLQDQQGQAQRNYETSGQQNTQGYANTRNGYLNQSRANMNAVQRLLGINGSGSSSAAYDMAPYAVAQNGSQGLGEAQQTYANNMSSLDTNWQDAQKGYQNSFDDLNQQKYSQENGIRSSIAQTRAGLLSQIGQANQNRSLAMGQNYEQARAAANPYTEQVNSLLSQITNLGQQYQNPILKANAPTYAAPDLGKYTLRPGQAPTSNQGGPAADLNPGFLGMIAGKERDKYGQVLPTY